MRSAKSLDNAEVVRFYRDMTIISLGVLGGIYGEKWIKDFMAEALKASKSIKVETPTLH